MTNSVLLSRIAARPEVFGGKPIVRDMRISVEPVRPGPGIRPHPFIGIAESGIGDALDPAVSVASQGLAKASTVPALDDEGRIACLRLIRSENVGPIAYRHLIERYGSASRALEALPSLARRGGNPTPRICGEREALAELEALERLGARPIVLGEPAYPEALAMLPDAPPVISVKGRSDLLDRPAVAVVGARNASIAGRRYARTLARELGEAGFAVVSGLARGIDTAAHVGALETGTLAVLAGGIDAVYPPGNADLQSEISERGLLVAEQKIGRRPRARHFPTRNRLISGLSLGVVVVEAALRSGSLITARCALEQGREVFAVPGSPLDPRCHGCNGLIRDGAVLVQSASDIASALDLMTQSRQHRPPARQPPEPPRRRPVATPVPDDGQPADSRGRVAAALSPTPVTVDELLRHCHLTLPALLTILLELEAAGRLHRHPGNRVSLCDRDVAHA